MLFKPRNKEVYCWRVKQEQIDDTNQATTQFTFGGIKLVAEIEGRFEKLDRGRAVTEQHHRDWMCFFQSKSQRCGTRLSWLNLVEISTLRSFLEKVKQAPSQMPKDSTPCLTSRHFHNQLKTETRVRYYQRRVHELPRLRCGHVWDR